MIPDDLRASQSIFLCSLYIDYMLPFYGEPFYYFVSAQVIKKNLCIFESLDNVKHFQAITIQGSDIAWDTFLMPFLSESWMVVIVVLLLTAATLALVVVAGRYINGLVGLTSL